MILKNSNAFSLETILQMMTFNNASALNLDNEFGSLMLGKNTGLNLVNLKNDQLELTKKII